MWNTEWEGYEGGYEALIDELGYERLITVSDDDYQGDSYMLLRDGETYGYLVFGWGSCSGCDALQACETHEEVEELKMELEQAIYWGESLEDVKAYVGRADEVGRFYGDRSGVREFSKQLHAFRGDK